MSGCATTAMNSGSGSAGRGDSRKERMWSKSSEMARVLTKAAFDDEENCSKIPVVVESSKRTSRVGRMVGRASSHWHGYMDTGSYQRVRLPSSDLAIFSS